MHERHPSSQSFDCQRADSLRARWVCRAGFVLALLLGLAGELDAEPAASDGDPARDWLAPLEVDHELAAWARGVAPPELTPLRRLRILSRALLDPRQIGMRERREPTYTAMEAFARREANCVGYALLLVGLAREAGVPAFFVLVEDLGGPARETGELRITESHLAAAWGSAERLRIFDFAGESGGGEHRTLAITDLTAIALYHSNRGVETMLAGRDAEAVEWLRRAVDLDPALAVARVNLGVALRRAGDLDGAEAEYREALRIDPGAEVAYRSLAALLRLRGETRDAEALLADAARLEHRDALAYLALAERKLRTGELRAARGLYRHALELARGGDRE